MPGRSSASRGGLSRATRAAVAARNRSQARLRSVTAAAGAASVLGALGIGATLPGSAHATTAERSVPAGHSAASSSPSPSPSSGTKAPTKSKKDAKSGSSGTSSGASSSGLSPSPSPSPTPSPSHVTSGGS
jgi:hypothetical protein